MQPIQIGMNAAVVLVALLLAVPVQLFISHYMSKSAMEEEGKNIHEIRADAMSTLGDTAETMMEKLYFTVNYYSSWTHMKELLLVPYQKKDKRMKTVHLKSTVVKNDRGTTTTLLISTSKPKAEGDSNPQDKVIRIPPKVTKPQSQGTFSASKQRPDTKTKAAVDEGTSPAREVEEYLMKEVYFTQSKTPRESKPASVKYSVGHVIVHKQAGYRGVIIGWDEVAKAPEDWIERYYSKRKDVTTTPHYLVLADSHFDASAVPYHYIPQEDIEIVTNVQTQCPEMSKYFEGYKNGRHIPKPWLQNRYPRDQ